MEGNERLLDIQGRIPMIELFGKKYLSQKEAIKRYHYSSSWFEQRRKNKEKPDYIRRGKTLVYYEMESTDKWFQDQIRVNE